MIERYSDCDVDIMVEIASLSDEVGVIENGVVTEGGGFGSPGGARCELDVGGGFGRDVVREERAIGCLWDV